MALIRHKCLYKPGAIAVLCLVFAVLAAQASAETRTYSISLWSLATYSQDGDCRVVEPEREPGRSPIETMYRRILVKLGKSPAEVEELMKSYDSIALGPLADTLINRGRVNGQAVNVYQNPEAYPDPQISTVQGKYAIGFNLDGRGAEDPAAFEDPYSHEKGVDNQYFRAVGCIGSSRAIPPDYPDYWENAWRGHAERSAAWLISITGEDLSRDGEVTVAFDTAIEQRRLDALGQPRADMTFRIDPGARNRAVFRGWMKDGVLTTEPAHFKMTGIITDFDITSTRLRLRMKADGSLEALMGGYQTWHPIYFFYARNGFIVEGNFGVDMPGVYYALKRFADADPDPVTGQNRRISVAYAIHAIPAFVSTDPDAVREPDLTRVSMQGPSLASASKEPEFRGGAALARRLTADQYRRIVSDVFGPSIDVSGRFEPDVRDGPVGGLAAVGAARVSVTTTGFEQYDGTARAIAAKVMDEENRKFLLPCKPVAADEPDDACSRTFLAAAGRHLYRRPLTSSELDTFVAAARKAAGILSSFYGGLEMSLAGMLQSVAFLFREEVVEPDPTRPGQYRLDAYSKASRLSFLLWDAGPDPQLLAAAESGEIHTRDGLRRQADRLLSSPRLKDGVRAFFTDMLHLDQLASISKETKIYPKYTAEVPRDALEQTLRTITDHLLTRREDYRDLFTTRKTFLTPTLASVYGVPMSANNGRSRADSWRPYEYAEGDPRAGILTHISFVSLHSHPGRTSPTLRGKALREILFCEKVPDPPANVDFAQFEQLSTVYKTTRERLAAHSNEPMCAGCHKITDPMGLALENFDSSGGFRTAENGVRIDTSGTFNGKKFSNTAELGKAVREYRGAASCMVDKLYAYAVGRMPEKAESAWVAYLKQSFADAGYRVPDLLRQLVTSPAFYSVVQPPEPAGAESKIVAETAAGSTPVTETKP